MLEFLGGAGFFSERQYGFLDGRSTELALSYYIFQIVEGLEAGKRVAAVYLDISKVSDTVRHNILSRKIFNAGFRGFMLDWFQSFLSGRTL